MCFLLLAAITAFVASCGGGGPKASPAVSPVASSVTIDLALADKLYADGESEQAVQIYSAAALRGTREQKQDAVWKLARIQYGQGDENSAAVNTQAFLAGDRTPELERQAYLLLGYSSLAQGNSEGARAAFEKYVETGGPAAPYARLKLAEIANGKGEAAKAVQLANDALSASLPPATATEAMFALARYQEAAGDAPGAAATYEKLLDGAQTAEDGGEALWGLAQLSRRTGDTAGYLDALHKLIARYPSHSRSLQALNEPQAGSLRERALVLVRQRQNDDAKAAYDQLVSDPDVSTQAEAHYFLGILSERASDPGQALNEYGEAISLLQGSGSALLGDAYWDSATVLEAQGMLDDATDRYSRIAGEAPGSEHAAEGLFRAGLMRFKQERPGQAAEMWSRYLDLAADAESKARAEYWLSRVYKALGEDGQGTQALEAAVSASPLDYYGLRSAAALKQSPSPPAEARAPGAETDWAAIQAWLVETAGPPPSSGANAIEQSAGWQRAVELFAAGLTKESSREFRALTEDRRPAWDYYKLARVTSEEGQAQPAALAAAALAGGRANAPRELLALEYPARFSGAAETAAKANEVPLPLLLGLVRQESFFDPAAVSTAGAVGLTQVVPSTATQIAAELKDGSFKESDLLKPQVSLRFGAHYLKSQIDGFDGSYAAALAAYNGGPGNAGRWQEASRGDEDLLLESIDYPETRTYVKVVLENYAMYEYIYGDDGGVPALP